MSKKKFTKSTEEIVALIESKVKTCSNWYESKLSKERELVQNFYNGTKPKRQHQGSSTYVANDVYDSVEMMKAQLLETFATGHEIVRFDPVGPEDVEDARIATAYTAHMVFSLNDGFGLFNDAIHDGLMTRVGVTKVYWEEDYKEQEETFEGLEYEQVEAIAADDEVDSLEADDNGEGLFDGTLIRKRSCSRVKYDVVPSEEFLIEERAKSIEDAKLTSHRTLKSRAELLKMGYPKRKVNNLNFEDQTALDLSPDKQARDELTGNQHELTGDDVLQQEMQYVLLYETHMEMVLEKDGLPRLYRMVHAGTEIFEGPEVVDRKPYKAFVPLPIPHMFYGNNFGYRITPHQTARTALVRSVLDHAAITNNPRLQVVKGSLLNPRELLDNRLGGLVNVSRPDGVVPMPQTPLNPFVFEIIGMMKESREETTGISALSQGLNKDAISKQNSTDLIDKMVSVSQQRQKIVARNFGKYLKELWLETYRLIIENEDQERIFEYAGNVTKVNPSAWIERRDVTVSLHLGYGEQDKEAQKFLSAYRLLSSDQSMAPLFTIEKKHKLITDTMNKHGIRNVDDYLDRPENYQPPPPDPLAVKELEIKDKVAQAAIEKSKADAIKIQVEGQIALAKLEIEKLKLVVTQEKNENDDRRKDAETVNRIDVSQRELELAEKVPPEGQRGIFSANS